MDKEHSDSVNKELLIDKIRAILYYEANKEFTTMDDDLISECADYLMELENRKQLTEEEIDGVLRHIFEKTKPNRRKRFSLKKLLWAAIIAVLLFVTAFTALTYGQDDALEHFRQWGKTIFGMVSGESIETDNKTIIKTGNYSSRYDSVDELFENEDLDILYPAALPDGEELVQISCSYKTEGVSITYVRSNPSYSIIVDNFSDISWYTEIPGYTTENINGFNCYFAHIKNHVDDYIQCVFNYKGYTYSFGAPTHEEIKFIINNLKEYQP